MKYVIVGRRTDKQWEAYSYPTKAEADTYCGILTSLLDLVARERKRAYESWVKTHPTSKAWDETYAYFIWLESPFFAALRSLQELDLGIENFLHHNKISPSDFFLHVPEGYSVIADWEEDDDEW